MNTLFSHGNYPLLKQPLGIASSSSDQFDQIAALTKHPRGVYLSSQGRRYASSPIGRSGVNCLGECRRW